jgi:hypothetical protein
VNTPLARTQVGNRKFATDTCFRANERFEEAERTEKLLRAPVLQIEGLRGFWLVILRAKLQDILQI